MNNVRVNHGLRAQWPDLSKDQKAVELAKVAMGWEDLTTEDQMDSSRKLVELATIYRAKL